MHVQRAGACMLQFGIASMPSDDTRPRWQHQSLDLVCGTYLPAALNPQVSSITVLSVACGDKYL